MDTAGLHPTWVPFTSTVTAEDHIEFNLRLMTGITWLHYLILCLCLKYLGAFLLSGIYVFSILKFVCQFKGIKTWFFMPILSSA